jgi:hypothetical protein
VIIPAGVAPGYVLPDMVERQRRLPAGAAAALVNWR